MGAVIPVAAALLAGAPAGAAIQVNPQGWKFPNIVTASKEAIRVSDRTPLIPGKETILRGYRKMDGTSFMTYEVEGRIFGVQVDTDGKPPFEFSIMDADGDGRFETKIQNAPGEHDQAYVPQWIIDHYYNVHPEMKNPSSKAKPPPPSLRVVQPEPPPPSAARPKREPPPPEILSLPNP
jgi:hypothetical protein